MTLLAQEYLALRRQLGYALRHQGVQLMAFARYADQVGHRGPITEELAVAWARLPKGTSQRWQARRLQIVRGFAEHRRLFDAGTEVPPAGLLGPYSRRRAPHVYSEEEISLLLKAAAELRPAHGLRSHSYVALFGLLVSTGLRISEALRLQRGEVDLKQGVLTVALTKFRKSRIVPLHPSTTQALATYAQRRDRHYPCAAAPHFFLGTRGSPLTLGQVGGTFNTLRRQLGWGRNREGFRPRVHDMRHTMAVGALLRWHREGTDVDRKMLSLSTYLGHVEVADTYWYLTAVPELMNLTAARFHAWARRSPGVQQ
jgi:integrase